MSLHKRAEPLTPTLGCSFSVTSNAFLFSSGSSGSCTRRGMGVFPRIFVYRPTIGWLSFTMGFLLLDASVAAALAADRTTACNSSSRSRPTWGFLRVLLYVMSLALGHHRESPLASLSQQTKWGSF